MENSTILIVDDTVENLDILENMLGGYDIISVTNGEEAILIAKEEQIDLILLDIIMPNMDGYEVCKILKDSVDTKHIPIIFITATSDEDSIEKAYDIGAEDYVKKPFLAKELTSRVKKELKIQGMIKELKHLASVDPMTKLYNRGYFSKVSEDTLNFMKREKKALSVIIIDVDTFKSINDTYGHQVGDKVIIELANKLLMHKRKSDIICRYGGEEFIILLPSTSIEGATILAQNIRKNIEKTVIEFDTNKTLSFTISIGVSEINIENENNIEYAIKRADNSLYIAKRNGKNKVIVS